MNVFRKLGTICQTIPDPDRDVFSRSHFNSIVDHGVVQFFEYLFFDHFFEKREINDHSLIIDWSFDRNL